MKRLRHLLALVLMVGAALTLSLPVRATSREYEIKAAFVYNFLRFVQWPSPANTMVVGVLGADPFEGGLRDFEAKPLAGKSINVKILTNVKDAKNCNVVYVARSEQGELDKTLSALKGTPVLTISDIPQFADHGGAIALTIEQNRVRFIINTDTLKEGSMKASAQLLKLASRTISLEPRSWDAVAVDMPLPPEIERMFRGDLNAAAGR